MAIRKCIICGCGFQARRDAKTCSARCRKRLQLIKFSLQNSALGPAMSRRRQRTIAELAK